MTGRLRREKGRDEEDDKRRDEDTRGKCTREREVEKGKKREGGRERNGQVDGSGWWTGLHGVR